MDLSSCYYRNINARSNPPGLRTEYKDVLADVYTFKF
jgi:hypothetical protein